MLRALKRRSANEATIEHMKGDGGWTETSFSAMWATSSALLTAGLNLRLVVAALAL